MTLAQWAQSWPYTVKAGDTALQAATGGFSIGTLPTAPYAVTADGGNALESGAWSLDDYQVATVQGGSIWFKRRERRATETTPRYSNWHQNRVGVR